MGRLSGQRSRRSKRKRRRGALGRPLLLFALLLLGPAAGFCVLGWNSVVRQHEYGVREMHRAAQNVLRERLAAAAGELERIRRVEAKRDYYEYQEAFLPREQVVQGLAFQTSPLGRAPGDRRVAGHFQWELFRGKAYGTPRVLPSGLTALRKSLAAGYGAALRHKLLDTPRAVDVRAGRARVEVYSQRVVAANEERGQLQEELALEKRAAHEQDLRYLKNFRSRAREAPVHVRYSPFRYLARPAHEPGPALIAWRMVWVAAEQIQWREVKRDRWLIQGYAIDPMSLFPDAWEAIGSSQIVRADRLGDLHGEGVFTASLAGVLNAERTAGPARAGEAAPPLDASLALASRADLALARSAWRGARNRFLLLVAGLISVVGVGFFVLLRSVRREVLLVRRKEDFIAAITHELKTPLTGIRMYADMLRQGWVESPEAADQYAEHILDETKRLGHLVDQVLDLAALERGVAKLRAQPGDLGQAMTSAVALIEPKARGAGVALSVEIEEGLPAVSFDPKLVRPLVLNLVDNAIKYSARAEIRTVRAGVRREGERAVLWVADRGIGIPLKAQKTIFDPFQRGGEELTRTTTGIGIGLALVKRYADAHRARVQLTSAPGKGTTIEVFFRLDRRSAGSA